MPRDAEASSDNAGSTAAWFAGGATVVLLGFLLYALWPSLNPLVLLLALGCTMAPLRRTRFFWPVLGAASGLTFFWLLSELGFMLAPFVLGLVFAYILNPLVDLMARRSFLSSIDGGDAGARSRTAAIGVLVLPLIGIFAALLIWGVPVLVREANGLVQRTPELVAAGARLLTSLEERLSTLPGFEGTEWAARLQSLDGDDVVEFLQTRGESLARQAWQGALGLGRGLGSIFSILGYLVLTPVVAFYLMRDYKSFGESLMSLIPEHRSGVRSFLVDYDRLLSGYLRGQVTVAIVMGTVTAVGLWIAQFPFAALLGFLAAVFGVVPYLGLVLSLIPAVGIALTSGAIASSFLKLAIVYGLVQVLEGMVLGPRILGESTGLHPVSVLLAIALGGFFFGFVGLLIAVPAAVGVKLLVERAVQRYKSSGLFLPEGGGTATEEA